MYTTPPTDSTAISFDLASLCRVSMFGAVCDAHARKVLLVSGAV
jgi:hypothetical protein